MLVAGVDLGGTNISAALVGRVAAAAMPYLLDREVERRFLAGAPGDDAGILGAAAVASSSRGQVAGTG